MNALPLTKLERQRRNRRYLIGEIVIAAATLAFVCFALFMVKS